MQQFSRLHSGACNNIAALWVLWQVHCLCVCPSSLCHFSCGVVNSLSPPLTQHSECSDLHGKSHPPPKSIDCLSPPLQTPGPPPLMRRCRGPELYRTAPHGSDSEGNGQRPLRRSSGKSRGQAWTQQQYPAPPVLFLLGPDPRGLVTRWYSRALGIRAVRLYDCPTEHHGSRHSSR